MATQTCPSCDSTLPIDPSCDPATLCASANSTCCPQPANSSLEFCVDFYPKGALPPHITDQQIGKLLVQSRPELMQMEPEIVRTEVSKWRAAFLKAKLWSAGKTLRVRFLDGEPWRQKWVEKVVMETWQPLINLKLVFGSTDTDAEIRITFANKGASYSMIGTDSILDLTGESMNLGWVDPWSGTFDYKGVTYTIPDSDSELRNGSRTKGDKYDQGGTVLHEWGHALGMIHEHNNPNGAVIKWNKDLITKMFACCPNCWNAEETASNVFETYDASTLNSSTFDPDSIMLYFFPDWLTTDCKGTHMNAVPSATDKQWMKNIYPTNATGMSSGTSKTNVLFIILGIVLLALLVFFIIRRK